MHIAPRLTGRAFLPLIGQTFPVKGVVDIRHRCVCDTFVTARHGHSLARRHYHRSQCAGIFKRGKRIGLSPIRIQLVTHYSLNAPRVHRVRLQALHIARCARAHVVDGLPSVNVWRGALRVLYLVGDIARVVVCPRQMCRGSTRLSRKLRRLRHGNVRQQQAGGAGHALRVGAHTGRRPGGRHNAAIAVDRSTLGCRDGKLLLRTGFAFDINPCLAKRIVLPTVLQLLRQLAVHVCSNLERHLFAGLRHRFIRGHRSCFKLACMRRTKGRISFFVLAYESTLRGSFYLNIIPRVGRQAIKLAAALRCIVGNGNHLEVFGACITVAIELLPHHFESTNFAVRGPGNLARSRAGRPCFRVRRRNGRHGQVGRRAGSVRCLIVFTARSHATERRSHVVRAHVLHRERRHAGMLAHDILVALRKRGEVLLAGALTLPGIRNCAAVVHAGLRRKRCIRTCFHPCCLGHLLEFGRLDSGHHQCCRVNRSRELAGHAVHERGNAYLIGRAGLKAGYLVAQLTVGARRQTARSHRVRSRTRRVTAIIQLRALDLIPLGVCNRHPRNRDAGGRWRVARNARRGCRRNGHRHNVRTARDRLIRRGCLHAQLPLPPVIFGAHPVRQGCCATLTVIIKRSRGALGLPIRFSLAPGVPLQLGTRRELPAVCFI